MSRLSLGGGLRLPAGPAGTADRFGDSCARFSGVLSRCFVPLIRWQIPRVYFLNTPHSFLSQEPHGKFRNVKGLTDDYLLQYKDEHEVLRAKCANEVNGMSEKGNKCLCLR